MGGWQTKWPSRATSETQKGRGACQGKKSALPKDALDAIVNVTERTRLLPVAPHFELDLRGDAFAAECSRRLLATALPSAERAVDVVKASDAALKYELARIW